MHTISAPHRLSSEDAAIRTHWPLGFRPDKVKRMTFRLPSLLTLLCLFACERSAERQATDSTAVVTQTAAIPSPRPDKVEDPIFSNFWDDAPDSSYGAWDRGSHVRHPSGLLVMWLDTAIRATEDHPVERAHADSILVKGLQHGEGLGRFCMVNGSTADRIVGVVRDTTTGTRPRLAWLFDSATFRIKATPTDSVTCFLHDPMEHEEVD